MPVFITQGRFTQNAVKGMLARPEDRTEALSQLIAKTGGKLIAYYMTFGGEYDFLVVSEGPMEGAAVAIVAAVGGGVTDVKTTLAMTSADMKNLLGRFRSAGTELFGEPGSTGLGSIR